MNKNCGFESACTGALFLAVGMLSSPVASWASQEWAEDLAFYRSRVFEADASYSPAERVAADTLLTRLTSSYESMSNAEIELALAEISALANNGHSFLMPGGWTHRYARLPLNLHVFADGIYVISASEPHGELVGRRLVGIEGLDEAQLRSAWSRYQGGLDGWRNQYLPYFLETPEMLKAAGLVEESTSVKLLLAGPDDNTDEFDVPARSDLPSLEGIEQYLAPSQLLVKAQTPGDRPLPLYLQQAGRAFRFEPLEAIDAAYLQFKANTDYSGNQDIDAFLDSVSAQLRSMRPGFVILDQRFNYGGDLNITRELMQKLPDFIGPEGRIFVITSGRTFSAGISSVGYLKQAAPQRVVLVGEPVGDALEFWAEGELQVLPNSGVAFLMATERHNYVTGCPEKDCHGSIRRHPIRVESLQPDVPAPLHFAEYAQGIDPALNAIRGRIRPLR